MSDTHMTRAASHQATGASTSAKPPPPAKTDLTPDQALDRLKKGNAEFVQGNPPPVANSAERRLEIAAGQAPFAVLVGCSDSRVPPEILFSRGLGELFIVRIAGNTVDQAALGTIEYAVAELGVPLIIVLGHENCGAVAAAMSIIDDNATFPGSMNDMVVPILPAVLKARGQPGNALENAVRENVRRVVDRLKTSEPVIRDPLQNGKLKIVGCYYGLADGKVDFFIQ